MLRFLNGSPEGSLGLAAPSGWMNSALFAHVLQHFIQTTRCSQENPVILTMDNYPSHISVNALKLAKDHGVNIITLPPHTSHKTQPLDRTVFGQIDASPLLIPLRFMPPEIKRATLCGI